MKRWARMVACGILFQTGSCLPDNIFADLAGSTLSAIVSTLLSDAFDVLLPPV